MKRRACCNQRARDRSAGTNLGDDSKSRPLQCLVTTPRTLVNTNAISASLLHSTERHGPDAEPVPLPKRNDVSSVRGEAAYGFHNRYSVCWHFLCDRESIAVRGLTGFQVADCNNRGVVLSCTIR